MSRQIPWESIPDRNIYEDGFYLFKIQDIKEQEEAEVLTYLARYEAEEPDDYATMPYFERFMVGTEEDPQAEDPLTWRKSRGAQSLKKLLAAAQVPALPDDDQTFAAAKDCRFVGRVAKTLSKKDGNTYNNIRGYYAVTSPEAAKVGVVGAAGVMKQAAQLGAAPSQPAKMKCLDCGEEVDRAEYGKHVVSHRSAA